MFLSLCVDYSMISSKFVKPSFKYCIIWYHQEFLLEIWVQLDQSIKILILNTPLHDIILKKHNNSNCAIILYLKVASLILTYWRHCIHKFIVCVSLCNQENHIVVIYSYNLCYFYNMIICLTNVRFKNKYIYNTARCIPRCWKYMHVNL
jgi:hypothetical protein